MNLTRTSNMKITGEITEEKLIPIKLEKLKKWMKRNAGSWFEMDIKVLGQAKCRKTAEQLGFHYGLLLPEIHEQYLREGMTVTVIVPGIRVKGKPMLVNRKPTQADSHEVIKDICGLVGESGERMDMRDMGKYDVMKFIDNELFHATHDLLMDGAKLEAKRPKKDENKSEKSIDNSKQ